MSTDRLSALCGLYLDFASVRSCIEEMKTIGVRTMDVSMVLPDGSIMSAIATPQLRRSSGDFQDSDITSQNIEPNYTARVTSFANALTKTLFTLGVPAYDSERLESKIRNGGILVSVRCNCLLAERVKEVFLETGAPDVSVARDAGTPGPQNYPAPKERRYTTPSIDGWRQHAAHA